MKECICAHLYGDGSRDVRLIGGKTECINAETEQKP